MGAPTEGLRGGKGEKSGEGAEEGVTKGADVGVWLSNLFISDLIEGRIGKT